MEVKYNADAPVVRQRYRELLQHLGLQLVQEVGWAELNWTGTDSSIHLSDSHSTSELAHELGHYLVATPRERTLPEYGCGVSDAAWADVEVMAHREAYYLERLASVLGIYIELYTVDRDRAMETFAEHNWEHISFAMIARDLRRRRLLVWRNGKLIPMALVNAGIKTCRTASPTPTSLRRKKPRRVQTASSSITSTASSAVGAT